MWHQHAFEKDAPRSARLLGVGSRGAGSALMTGPEWRIVTSESLWQMPQAWTLIRTQPAAGWEISRSTISNGPFGRAICAARIFDINQVLVLEKLHN